MVLPWAQGTARENLQAGSEVDWITSQEIFMTEKTAQPLKRPDPLKEATGPDPKLREHVVSGDRNTGDPGDKHPKKGPLK